MRFGLLSYRTTNIGDDIQSVAAAGLLPRIDEYVQRDELGSPRSHPVACILNGWFLHGSSWPPNPGIDALVTSFHISCERSVREVVGGKESLDWLRRHGPVGCRSQSTLDFLEERGIDCHLSGCLTLTLHRPDVDRTDQIVWVDQEIPDGVLPDAVARRSIKVTHTCAAQLSVPERLAAARRLLRLYASAHLVITTRLHAALPCIAFGTPVVLAEPDYQADRLDCYRDLPSAFVGGSELVSLLEQYPWEAPPAPTDPVRFAEPLRRRVADWVKERSVESLGVRGTWPVRTGCSDLRPVVFGLGLPKSGTVSLARLLRAYGNSRHEPGASELIGAILNHQEGLLDELALAGFLLGRDRRLGLDAEVSQLLMFVADQLVELFPNARFILTVREPLSWLNSIANHHRSMDNDGPGMDGWRRLNRYRFGSADEAGAPDPLTEQGLFSANSYLSYWRLHLETVERAVPMERLLVVRTDQLSDSTGRIEEFVGLPAGSLDRGDRGRVIENRGRDKVDLLAGFGSAELAAKVEECCVGYLNLRDEAGR